MSDEPGDRSSRGSEGPRLEFLHIAQAAAARKFLYSFHNEALITAAQARRGPEEIAYIPEETAPLQGLARVNRTLVQEVGRRCPDQGIVAVDQDATIIESHKQATLRAYEGGRGYQPMLAVWSELNLVVADEFRDGNVPANYGDCVGVAFDWTICQPLRGVCER